MRREGALGEMRRRRRRKDEREGASMLKVAKIGNHFRRLPKQWWAFDRRLLRRLCPEPLPRRPLRLGLLATCSLNLLEALPR